MEITNAFNQAKNAHAKIIKGQELNGVQSAIDVLLLRNHERQELLVPVKHAICRVIITGKGLEGVEYGPDFLNVAERVLTELYLNSLLKTRIEYDYPNEKISVYFDDDNNDEGDSLPHLATITFDFVVETLDL